MSQFRLDQTVNGNILVLATHGYIEENAAAQLVELVNKKLDEGSTRFVLDLTDSKVVASPGLAGVLDICIRIVDDFGGRVVICGLDKMKENVFSMAAIFQYAEKTPTQPEAVALLSDG